MAFKTATAKPPQQNASLPLSLIRVHPRCDLYGRFCFCFDLSFCFPHSRGLATVIGGLLLVLGVSSIPVQLLCLTQGWHPFDTDIADIQEGATTSLSLSSASAISASPVRSGGDASTWVGLTLLLPALGQVGTFFGMVALSLLRIVWTSWAGMQLLLTFLRWFAWAAVLWMPTIGVFA